MVRLALIAALFAWSFAPVAEALAQAAPLDTTALDTTALRADVEAGIAALEAERPEEAAALLAPVVRAAPAFRLAERGAAAYWLGQAHAAADRPDEAFAAWAAGQAALSEAGAFDARLADAFIRQVFERRDVARYRAATEAYLRLLRQIDAPGDASTEAVLVQHLEALALVLPEAVRAATGLRPEADDPEADEASSLKPGAGAALVAWWRRQDPTPATRENERLEEHLQRWLYAQAHYEKDGRLDARGQVYVRLGAPYKKTSVDFDGYGFRRKVLNQNPTLTAFGFRRNEFWVYPHVDHAAHYLFVRERRGWYVEAEPTDLVPSTLRMGFSSGSSRGRSKSEAFIRSMNEVYRQLALYHIDYASAYEGAASYADLLDMQAFAGRSFSPSGESPAVAAQRLLSESRTEAFQNARRRRESVPEVYAGPVGEASPLPVEVRLARFLQADGATRAEVYWSAPAAALLPPREVLRRLDREDEGFPERYFLAVAVTQQRGQAEARTVARKRHLISAPREAEGLLAPQTYTLPPATARTRIGVQWDEYAVYPDAPEADAGDAPEADAGDAPRLGPHLRRATFHADSLAPLVRDESVLEMSDLKPLFLHDEQKTGPDALAEAPPYPFAHVTPSTPLALYFEVYHLAFGADDEARYTVEYDVARQTEPGGLARLFRRGEEQRTTTRTAYTAQSRTAREHILLDLDAEEQRAGTLTITVRVTDETTGQSVERAISFEVVPPAEETAAE